MALRRRSWWMGAYGLVAAAMVFGCSSDTEATSGAGPDAVGGGDDTATAVDSGSTTDVADMEGDASSVDAGDDTTTPTAKSPEAACAEIALCTGTLAEFGLNQCPSLIRTANRDRERILETLATDDLVRLKRLDCLLAANGDCAAIDVCLRPPRVSATVCDAQEGFHQVCDSDVRVDCPFSGEPSYLDCAAAGMVCKQAGNEAQCSADVPCTNAVCDGDVIVTCDKQVVKRRDCRGQVSVSCSGACNTTVSETCVSTALTAYCGATGPDCEGDQFTDGCQDDKLVACTQGKVGTLDCSAQGDGWTCNKEPSFDYFWCGPAAMDCEFDMMQTCSDGVITFCDSGTVATFDCATIGASGCELRTGITQVPFGACTDN